MNLMTQEILVKCIDARMKSVHPFCVTIDYKTIEDNMVTVRDRDTMRQERIEIGKLKNYLATNRVIPLKTGIQNIRLRGMTVVINFN